MSSDQNKSIYLERIDTCKACPHLSKLTKTCRKCNCFVFFKAAMKNERCPEDLWPSLSE